MGTLARILVGDDLEREDKFTPPVQVRIASDLASVLNYDLELVHIYDLPDHMPATVSAATESVRLLEGPYVEEAQKLLSIEAEELQKALPDLQTSYSVDRGHPVDVFLQHAYTQACDVIVLGTHARKGIRRALVGSVTEEVIQKSPVPVLSVNPNFQQNFALEEHYMPKKILVPLYLENHKEEQNIVLKFITDFAGKFKIPVVLVHVVEEWVYPVVQSAALLAGGVAMPLEKNLKELAAERYIQLEDLAAKLRLHGIQVESQVVERAKDIGSAIIQSIHTFQCNLVVMKHRKRNAAASAILGSVSRYVVREAPCPVLGI